jgi:hypothetical protein
LQALLWFVIGHARSLSVVSVVGLLTGLGFLVPLLIWQEFWLAILAAFVVLRSWNGLQQARQLALAEKLAELHHQGPHAGPDTASRYSSRP